MKRPPSLLSPNPILKAPLRSKTVKLLLPLVSSVADVPCRIEVYSLVWAEAVEEEMQAMVEGRTMAGGGGCGPDGTHTGMGAILAILAWAERSGNRRFQL